MNAYHFINKIWSCSLQRPFSSWWSSHKNFNTTSRIETSWVCLSGHKHKAKKLRSSSSPSERVQDIQHLAGYGPKNIDLGKDLLAFSQDTSEHCCVWIHGVMWGLCLATGCVSEVMAACHRLLWWLKPIRLFPYSVGPSQLSSFLHFPSLSICPRVNRERALVHHAAFLVMYLFLCQYVFIWRRFFVPRIA